EQTYKLFCMGNPLLDICVNADEELLKKYEELVNNYKVEYVAGGATQNTGRSVQYLLPSKTTIYFGCVGKDKYADIMRKVAEKDGLIVDYLVDNEHPTGTCAVIITGYNRSLIANLSAANHYQKSKHLDLPEKWKIVENAKFYYIGGFFLTVSPDSMLKVAKHAAENNKPFMTNLSAPFLCQVPAFKNSMKELVPYWDIIFGNESEAEAFAISENWENTKFPRVAIITQGSEPTIVAYQETGKVEEIPVIPIDKKEIVDTNGAGDTFVGGFLSQFIQGKSIKDSIKAGHWLANINLKRIGSSLPDEKIPYPC
ncbi:26359_t:CDS:2, partial [Dentiscutata erythropus]